ncbi:MAG: amidohydrolase family protein [Burkholderiales bacterium]|nr:amidohydrolase family protein [Burkholderiales bacterium]
MTVLLQSPLPANDAMPTIRIPSIPGFIPATAKPRTHFPAGACDCHAHVFGPQTRFPYLADAAYIPPDAVTADYLGMLKNNGCDRGVLVQPSIYGTDNRCMIDALRSEPQALRGIAVVEAGITDHELEDLHAAGVRGVRINLASETEGLTLADGERLAPRLKELGWHLQFYLDLPKMPEAEARLAKLPITIVIDHFARCPAAEGADAPAFRALQRLVGRDNCWAKIMGPYFISKNAPLYPEVTPLARALVAAAPDRIVWGSDWPHPGARALMPEDHVLADLLAQWVPDEAQRHRVLVDNPARLYGF